jgi:hypothetical protein
MTDDQLKQGQEIKRIIKQLENELEKFERATSDGINVFLPAIGEIIDNVKQVFIDHLNDYKDKFKKL